MATLNINKLKNGMTTHSEVIDVHGHTLIRANEKLTDKHITLLKMWGIPEIDVKDSINDLEIEDLKAIYSSSLINDLIEESQRKLIFIDSEPLLSASLKRIFIEYAAKGKK
jgi:hypothetical protein